MCIPQEAVAEDADDEAHGGELPRALPAAEKSIATWDSELGSAEWGLRPELLSEQLTQHCGDTRPVPGLRGCSQGGGVFTPFMGTRHQVHKSFYIPDRSFIPNEKLVNQVSCSMIHPGLCVTDDRAHYTEALRIARHIEKFFDKDKAGSFYLLLGLKKSEMGEGEEVEVYFLWMYLCHVRRRSSKVLIGETACLPLAPPSQPRLSASFFLQACSGLRCRVGVPSLSVLPRTARDSSGNRAFRVSGAACLLTVGCYKFSSAPQVPITHTMAVVDNSFDTLSFRRRAGEDGLEDKFSFKTPWEVARQILEAGRSGCGSSEVQLGASRRWHASHHHIMSFVELLCS